MEKYIQKPLGGAQAGFRLRQLYANLTPAHVFERAVSGLGFLGTGAREENFLGFAKELFGFANMCVGFS